MDLIRLCIISELLALDKTMTTTTTNMRVVQKFSCRIIRIREQVFPLAKYYFEYSVFVQTSNCDQNYFYYRIFIFLLSDMLLINYHKLTIYQDKAEHLLAS